MRSQLASNRTFGETTTMRISGKSRRRSLQRAMTAAVISTITVSLFCPLTRSVVDGFGGANRRYNCETNNNNGRPWHLQFRDPTITATHLDAVENNQETDSGSATTITKRGQRRVAILLCPAQFCVPADYEELWDALPDAINSIGSDSDSVSASSITIDKELSRVVPLSRRDWIKVARQLPTQNFVTANLAVHETLDWYFEALQEGLNSIWAEAAASGDGESVDVALVGHSIGGWVARAYLGGLDRSSTAVSRMAMERITSLITLGTPHISPDSALVDQTRGLLREIAEAPACSSKSLVEDRGIDVTCVCSSSLSGKFLTTNIEEFIAASSYLPLLGQTSVDTKGDGIVPLDLAFMEEPARKVVLDACPASGKPIRHSHVVPTPWNLVDGYSPSIRLSDDVAVSYISPEIVTQWAQYIR